MTPEQEFGTYSDEELIAEFDQLFPMGFAGWDVSDEIARGGWAISPLAATFHPTAEQLYEEAMRLLRNMQSLARPNHPLPPPPEPKLGEFQISIHDNAFDAEIEIRELVGKCLWDVFSDNHEVVAPNGRVLDLGSFRSSGGFLADYLNQKHGISQYDYMDFYLGTIWISDRADLTPVYCMIFRRLQKRSLDWIYHFPEIHAVDLRPLRDALKESEQPEWTNYSPDEAFANELQESQRDKELAEIREHLAQGNQEAKEEALKNPPPRTVAAYQAVYGKDPEGWPPIC